MATFMNYLFKYSSLCILYNSD